MYTLITIITCISTTEYIQILREEHVNQAVDHFQSFLPLKEIICLHSRLRIRRLVGQKVGTEILYHKDDALVYIAYVMLIWAAAIPADRWHCSLWP